MHRVRVVILLLSVLYSMSSCHWQEAKNIIVIADSIDQTEHVIYDDTMALKRVICSLDNPAGRILMSNTLGKAYYYMGRNYSLSNQIKEAAECYIEADRLQIDDPISRGRVNSCMGYICAQNNSDSLALIFYEHASKDFLESGNEWRYAQSLLNVSLRHAHLHQFKESDSLWQHAKTHQLDSSYKARFYEVRGVYFYEQQQYDSALICFKLGLNFRDNEQDKCFGYLKIMQSYYFGYKNIDSTLNYAQKIVSFSRNPNYISNAYFCLMQDAQMNSNTSLLSEYAHAREDANRLLDQSISSYSEAISLLKEYLFNPYPWRWVWLLLALMIAMCGVLIAGILIYRKRTRLQLHMSNEHIVELSTQLEKQENELNIACQKNHQTKMIDEIRIKYPTPPNKWNDYCRLKTDINPYLSTWLTALEELNLTNREKVLCTFIFLYPYLSAEELAKFMCMTKGGVQVIRTHVVKKVGITSTHLVDYLQEMSKEM